MTRARRVLFVTWDGPNSTYLETLFLPIFARLRERGFAFHVLQFSWSDASERARLAKACERAGLTYRAVTIWRRPVAVGSFVTSVWGRRHVARALDETHSDIVMPRSTLPGLAAIPPARRKGLPVLLDADGLPHDERVEFAGASPRGPSYRALRRLESWSVRKARAVTVRTAKAASILAARSGTDESRFFIVPNGRDESLFRPATVSERLQGRAELGLTADQPLLVYPGSSLSGKYRGKDMMRFFAHVRELRPDARVLLLMPERGESEALLRRFPDLAPYCMWRSAAPNEVPSWLGIADLGLALIHATFSMQAVSAIKVGEYLLCGLPVLGSAGVGDTDDLARAGVGYWLQNFDGHSLASAAAWFAETVLQDAEMFRQRCRDAGRAHYSLESAVAAYERALRYTVDPAESL